MGLIKCPDCGTEFSDTRIECPKCTRLFDKVLIKGRIEQVVKDNGEVLFNGPIGNASFRIKEETKVTVTWSPYNRKSVSAIIKPNSIYEVWWQGGMFGDRYGIEFVNKLS